MSRLLVLAREASASRPRGLRVLSGKEWSLGEWEDGGDGRGSGGSI